MISGHGPSAPPGSGGNATRTSIGTPSKVFTWLRAVPPGLPAIVWSQRRLPVPCTAQGIGAAVLLNTDVIVALAGEAASNNTPRVAIGRNQRMNQKRALRPPLGMRISVPPGADEVVRET